MPSMCLSPAPDVIEAAPAMMHQTNVRAESLTALFTDVSLLHFVVHLLNVRLYLLFPCEPHFARGHLKGHSDGGRWITRWVLSNE